MFLNNTCETSCQYLLGVGMRKQLLSNPQLPEWSLQKFASQSVAWKSEHIWRLESQELTSKPIVTHFLRPASRWDSRSGQCSSLGSYRERDLLRLANWSGSGFLTGFSLCWSVPSRYLLLHPRLLYLFLQSAFWTQLPTLSPSTLLSYVADHTVLRRGILIFKWVSVLIISY